MASPLALGKNFAANEQFFFLKDLLEKFLFFLPDVFVGSILQRECCTTQRRELCAFLFGYSRVVRALSLCGG